MTETADSGAVCPEQQLIIDELCGLAHTLEAIAASVRHAVEQNILDDLATLKEDFDKTREQIIEQAKRLAVHRASHGC
jgi:hypothetical protein